MTDPTLWWWALLCTVSAVNALAWGRAAWWARHHAPALPGEARRAIRWQLLLSAGYVLGCAYRSAFPVYDVGRQVLVDSWLSSVMMGRSVATVAELCFAAQWALLMHLAARANGHRLGLRVAAAVMPMIVTAEICSWHAVLTTSNLGHVIEETLWGLCAAALVLSLVLMWPRCDRALRPPLAAAAAIGVAYVVYMAQVDVPMYWGRWLAEAQRGHAPLSLAQGVVDASTRWVVSHRWADWQAEVVWMTLYFSVAVWLSIGLIRVPARLAASRATTAAHHPRLTLA
ncbi:hypothetical protein AACH10_07600 [Ideonella sp. DXS22W]|uniref:Uncharacterized protein n=1 Tax=Pseudaquabacterium inlustre TaxID=2984192 RepID=A0ABU9CDZ3_9BURK